MTLSIDLYWSFRSPYSYLATPRLRALEHEHELHVNVRPVLPLAVRDNAFFERVHPLWVGYLLRDIQRVAEFQGMTIRWPRPDPVVQDPVTRRAPAEQPYIHRLTRIGVLAAEAGHGMALLDEVSRLIWDGRVDGWHQGPHLAEAVGRAGLDLGALDAHATREAARLDAVIAENQKALERAGHWGVPTMVFEGEPFFGQDRIDVLVWRLKQRGLQRRIE